MNNFKYAITLAQMLYDIELNDMDTLIEIGLIAYNAIGNKNTQLNTAIVDVASNGKIDMPCKADLIEAITYPQMEDWNYTSNIKNFGDFNSLNIEQYVEKSKQVRDPLYISGRLVKYRREGNYIYVNENINQVCVLFHTEQLDEEGLPQITDKEALRNNNTTTFQLAQTIKTQWQIHCDAARVPEYVNQNEMNDLLDAMSSFNKKVHGKSYKPTL